MKLSIFKTAILSVAISGAFQPALADQQIPAGSSVAVLVNGQPVAQGSVDWMVERRAAMGEAKGEALTKRIKEELIIQTLFAQQAEKKHFDADPAIIAQLDLGRLNLLSKTFVNDYFKAHPVDEASMKADYDKRKAAGQILEYHVRHISVKTEDEARAIIKQLKEGADFAQIAKEKSTDPGADINGGDLGWFRPDIFVDRDFAEKVTKLKKGEFTVEPISTRWGWNIVKVEDGPRKAENLPEFEKIPPNTLDAMRKIKMQTMMEELIEQVKAKAVIAEVGKVKAQNVGMAKK